MTSSNNSRATPKPTKTVDDGLAYLKGHFLNHQISTHIRSIKEELNVDEKKSGIDSAFNRAVINKLQNIVLPITEPNDIRSEINTFKNMISILLAMYVRNPQLKAIAQPFFDRLTTPYSAGDVQINFNQFNNDLIAVWQTFKKNNANTPLLTANVMSDIDNKIETLENNKPKQSQRHHLSKDQRGKFDEATRSKVDPIKQAILVVVKSTLLDIDPAILDKWQNEKDKEDATQDINVEVQIHSKKFLLPSLLANIYSAINKWDHDIETTSDAFKDLITTIKVITDSTPEIITSRIESDAFSQTPHKRIYTALGGALGDVDLNDEKTIPYHLTNIVREKLIEVINAFKADYNIENPRQHTRYRSASKDFTGLVLQQLTDALPNNNFIRVILNNAEVATEIGRLLKQNSDLQETTNQLINFSRFGDNGAFNIDEFPQLKNALTTIRGIISNTITEAHIEEKAKGIVAIAIEEFKKNAARTTDKDDVASAISTFLTAQLSKKLIDKHSYAIISLDEKTTNVEAMKLANDLQFLNFFTLNGSQISTELATKLNLDTRHADTQGFINAVVGYNRKRIEHDINPLIQSLSDYVTKLTALQSNITLFNNSTDDKQIKTACAAATTLIQAQLSESSTDIALLKQVIPNFDKNIDTHNTVSYSTLMNHGENTIRSANLALNLFSKNLIEIQKMLAQKIVADAINEFEKNAARPDKDVVAKALRDYLAGQLSEKLIQKYGNDYSGMISHINTEQANLARNFYSFASIFQTRSDISNSVSTTLGIDATPPSIQQFLDEATTRNRTLLKNVLSPLTKGLSDHARDIDIIYASIKLFDDSTNNPSICATAISNIGIEITNTSTLKNQTEEILTKFDANTTLSNEMVTTTIKESRAKLKNSATIVDDFSTQLTNVQIAFDNTIIRPMIEHVSQETNPAIKTLLEAKGVNDDIRFLILNTYQKDKINDLQKTMIDIITKNDGAALATLHNKLNNQPSELINQLRDSMALYEARKTLVEAAIQNASLKIIADNYAGKPFEPTLQTNIKDAFSRNLRALLIKADLPLAHPNHAIFTNADTLRNFLMASLTDNTQLKSVVGNHAAIHCDSAIKMSITGEDNARKAARDTLVDRAVTTIKTAYTTYEANLAPLPPNFATRLDTAFVPLIAGLKTAANTAVYARDRAEFNDETALQAPILAAMMDKTNVNAISNALTALTVDATVANQFKTDITNLRNAHMLNRTQTMIAAKTEFDNAFPGAKHHTNFARDLNDAFDIALTNMLRNKTDAELNASFANQAALDTLLCNLVRAPGALNAVTTGAALKTAGFDEALSNNFVATTIALRDKELSARRNSQLTETVKTAFNAQFTGPILHTTFATERDTAFTNFSQMINKHIAGIDTEFKGDKNETNTFFSNLVTTTDTTNKAAAHTELTTMNLDSADANTFLDNIIRLRETEQKLRDARTKQVTDAIEEVKNNTSLSAGTPPLSPLYHDALNKITAPLKAAALAAGNDPTLAPTFNKDTLREFLRQQCQLNDSSDIANNLMRIGVTNSPAPNNHATSFGENVVGCRFIENYQNEFKAIELKIQQMERAIDTAKLNFASYHIEGPQKKYFNDEIAKAEAELKSIKDTYKDTTTYPATFQNLGSAIHTPDPKKAFDNRTQETDLNAYINSIKTRLDDNPANANVLNTALDNATKKIKIIAETPLELETELTDKRNATQITEKEFNSGMEILSVYTKLFNLKEAAQGDRAAHIRLYDVLAELERINLEYQAKPARLNPPTEIELWMDNIIMQFRNLEHESKMISNTSFELQTKTRHFSSSFTVESPTGFKDWLKKNNCDNSPGAELLHASTTTRGDVLLKDRTHGSDDYYHCHTTQSTPGSNMKELKGGQFYEHTSLKKGRSSPSYEIGYTDLPQEISDRGLLMQFLLEEFKVRDPNTLKSLTPDDLEKLIYKRLPALLNEKSISTFLDNEVILDNISAIFKSNTSIAESFFKYRDRHRTMLVTPADANGVVSTTFFGTEKRIVLPNDLMMREANTLLSTIIAATAIKTGKDSTIYNVINNPPPAPPTPAPFTLPEITIRPITFDSTNCKELTIALRLLLRQHPNIEKNVFFTGNPPPPKPTEDQHKAFQKLGNIDTKFGARPKWLPNSLASLTDLSSDNVRHENIKTETRVMQAQNTDAIRESKNFKP